MQKYTNAIQDVHGNAVAGATIAVYLYGTLTPATIYSDNGSTVIASSSVTSDSTGEFYFYAANGRYTLSVSAPQFASEQVSDVYLYDPTVANVVDTFTATAGQTVFTLTSAPGDIDALTVILNGASLTPTSEYTLSGVTLTLVLGAAAGDTLVARYGLPTSQQVIADGAVTDASVAPGSVLANLISQGPIEPYVNIVTATAGQTAFSLSFNPGSLNNLHVTLNGSKLQNGVDFTWASTTVTLATGAAAGDVFMAQYTRSTSVSSVPSGSVLDVSVATGSKLYNRINDWVSVKDFGAVCDGTTNDRAAFVLADAYAFANNKQLIVPGVSYIASPLTLTAPIADTLSQIFSSTSQVTVANKTCVRPEWWGAKQNTESTAAINRAIQSIGNGAILQLSGFYYVSGTGSECILIDRPLTIQGISAPRSGFVILNGAIGASTDVIRISPDMTKSDGEGYALYDFGVSLVTSTDGRHAIHLDITAAGQRLKNLYIHRCQTSRVGGHGIHVTNPIPNTDSVFTTSIRDCVVRNGIYLINAGDSIRIEDCTLTGENYGVWLQLISGANAPLVSGCNITNKSGAVYVYGPTNPIITDNNIESLSESDTTEKAFVVLTGQNGGTGPLVNPPRKAVVSNNIFGMLADGATPHILWGVYVEQGDSVSITANQFNRSITASQNAYYFGAYSRYCLAYANNISSATYQTGYTDAGQGTCGTVRAITAYNAGYAFYTAGGAWQEPRYTKDINQNVILSGAIALSGGFWTDGTAIFTLPVGYRPRLVKTFAATAYETAVGYTTVIMQITGGGAVSLRGVTGRSFDWVCYDGVTYMNYEA